jgi:signal transduction histidine kinase
MYLTEAFQSRFVQLGLLIGALTATLSGATLLFAYRAVDAAVLAQIDGEINAEFSELASLVKSGRVAEAGRLIRFRVADEAGVDRFYLFDLLATPQPEIVDEKYGSGARTDGWFEVEVATAEGTKPIRLFGQMLGDVYLAVGRDTAELASTRASILATFLVALAVTIGASLAATSVLTLRIGRRVAEIRRDIQRVQHDLQARIRLSGKGDEFDRIGAAFNVLLDRLAETMDRVRQVTLDIAHDLRTPLTRARHRIEAARGGKPGTQDEVLTDAAGTIDRLVETFNGILRIAQVEGSPIEREAVNLAEIASELVEIYAPVAEENGTQLTAELTGGILISGDHNLIRQLIANLIENAINHAAGARRIVAGVHPAGGGRAALTVRDDGCGIPEALRERVLERFVRLDRSRGTPGHGLGLSLVRAIAQAHQASLQLSAAAADPTRPGLLVTVSFPTAEAAVPALPARQRRGKAAAGRGRSSRRRRQL